MATAVVPKHGRARWGALQRYRAIGFVGHVARMLPEEHPVARAYEWRSLAWWHRCQQMLPAKAWLNVAEGQQEKATRASLRSSCQNLSEPSSSTPAGVK